MDEAFLGMINPFGFSFAPRGWAQCNGQILNITTNSALYSLLGTTFGGDGKTTFGLPDLRGRAIVGAGPATPYTSAVAWGEKSGGVSLTLNQNNLPLHNHSLVNGNGSNGTVKVTTTVLTVDNTNSTSETDNGSNVLGTAGSMLTIYRESPSGTDHLGSVISKATGTTSTVGGSTSLNLRNPYLGINYCIATQGYYPSRN
jgi:microcystin-dependent protein